MSSIAAAAVEICSSSTPDSSRNVTTSLVYSARSVEAQPSYCLSSREKRCQRGSVSRNCVASRSKTIIFSNFSDSRICSSSESFST
jgi:hypothetical protein